MSDEEEKRHRAAIEKHGRSATLRANLGCVAMIVLGALLLITLVVAFVFAARLPFAG